MSNKDIFYKVLNDKDYYLADRGMRGDVYYMYYMYYNFMLVGKEVHFNVDSISDFCGSKCYYDTIKLKNISDLTETNINDLFGCDEIIDKEEYEDRLEILNTSRFQKFINSIVSFFKRG
jgi:hypothetical protein